MSEYPPPDTTETAPGDEAKPWWKKWWGITLIVIVVIAALGTCGDTEEAGDPVATPTTGATEEVTPAETTPPEEIEQEVSEEPAEPITETPDEPAFEPIVLSGTGDDVVDVSMPTDQAGIITLTHQGGANFAVISYDPAGNRIDLLANVIGNYNGARPVNLTGTEPVGQLEITADGPWTAEIRSLAEARIEVTQTFSGQGPDVVILGGDTGNAASVTHDGSANFAVIAWGDSRDLLVNEIGAYQGRVRIPPGTILLDIQADGGWSFDFG
jgi:hypothetical protein